MNERYRIWGVAAEFDDPEALVEAARAVRAHGYLHVEAYTPYPIKELDEIVGGADPLPAMVLIGGLLGSATAWIMQYYIAAIDYPINVGGRPLYSWPSFIVILFELTVLFAACTAFFGMLGLAGFPRPNHPVFNVTSFGGSTRDRFFLCIEARSDAFDQFAAADLLVRLNPIEVWEVENS